MTLVDDIATALISAGHATAKGTDIFAYQFEPGTANQIMISEYRGQDPVTSISSATRRPGIVIMVKNASMATAESKALAIWDLLANAKGLQGHQHIIAAGSGLTYDKDENGRHIFIMSFYVFD